MRRVVPQFKIVHLVVATIAVAMVAAACRYSLPIGIALAYLLLCVGMAFTLRIAMDFKGHKVFLGVFLFSEFLVAISAVILQIVGPQHWSSSNVSVVSPFDPVNTFMLVLTGMLPVSLLLAALCWLMLYVFDS
jgi:hypothetical protein